jgi:hypothetical protein
MGLKGKGNFIFGMCDRVLGQSQKCLPTGGRDESSEPFVVGRKGEWKK